MPLVPRAEAPLQSHTVHDGAVFAKEVRHKDPRSPEANRILIDELHLGQLVRPVFVSPTCSYLQICSDVGVLTGDWMTQRAAMFHEREQSDPDEVTPQLPSKKPVTRIIPIAAWEPHENDEVPPPVPFVRRRMRIY